MKLRMPARLGLLLLVLVVTGARRTDGPTILSSYYVEVPDAIMQQVADRWEVHHRMGRGFEVLVPLRDANALKALVPAAVLLEADVDADIRHARLAGYHDFQSVQRELQQLVDKHPTMAALENYGSSQEGRPLLALKLTSDVQSAAGKPEIMLTSATHGNELISVEVLFGILNGLVDGYLRSDPRIKSILDSKVIWFVPVVNPDGYTRRERYSNGVDPNREYPWPEQPNRDPNECISAIMKFWENHDIKGSIDYHSSGGMVMYPWSYTSQKVPGADGVKFRETAKKMAAKNGYTPGQIPDLLYIAKGGSADYYYWKNQSLAMAIEIGNTNMPPTSQIPGHVSKNLAAALEFIDAVE